jgi:hypothetical protein
MIVDHNGGLQMNIFLTILRTLWPFFKEVVLGNKSVPDFIYSHRWVLSHVLFTLILFLLFINQYLIIINERLHELDIKNKSDMVILDLTTRNTWQAEKIKMQQDLLWTQAKDYKVLLTSLHPPSIAQVTPKLIKRTVNSLPKPDLVDDENINRLKRLSQLYDQ